MFSAPAVGTIFVAHGTRLLLLRVGSGGPPLGGRPRPVGTAGFRGSLTEQDFPRLGLCPRIDGCLVYLNWKMVLIKVVR